VHGLTLGPGTRRTPQFGFKRGEEAVHERFATGLLGRSERMVEGGQDGRTFPPKGEGWLEELSHANLTPEGTRSRSICSV
jgi:hypothetical protein